MVAITSNSVASVVVTTHAVCTSTDGLSKISDTVLAIFALIKHSGKSIPAALDTLGKALEGFSELTGIISLVKRGRDWFVPDENGKMMWQKAWQEISGTVCTTVSTILSFSIYLATTLKVYSLGVLLGPLNIINSAMSIGSSAFDIWDNANTLELIAKKTAKAVAKMEKWKKEMSEIKEGNALPVSWRQRVQKNKKIWTDRIAAYAGVPDDKQKLARAISKKENWEALEKCSHVDIKQYSKRQIVLLSNQIHSHKAEKAKSWMTIAVDVMYIALSVLSLIALFTSPGGLVLAMLLGGIAASVADLGSYVMDKHFNNGVKM